MPFHDHQVNSEMSVIITLISDEETKTVSLGLRPKPGSFHAKKLGCSVECGESPRLSPGFDQLGQDTV